MERKIGEEFQIVYDGKIIKLKVVEVDNELTSCLRCKFFSDHCIENAVLDQAGVCLSKLRSDRKPVIFVEVKQSWREKLVKFLRLYMMVR